MYSLFICLFLKLIASHCTLQLSHFFTSSLVPNPIMALNQQTFITENVIKSVWNNEVNLHNKELKRGKKIYISELWYLVCIKTKTPNIEIKYTILLLHLSDMIGLQMRGLQISSHPTRHFKWEHCTMFVNGKLKMTVFQKCMIFSIVSEEEATNCWNFFQML